MELFKNTNFDFLGKKWPFIIMSLLLTAAGLASLVVKGGPLYGIDFRGGALIYVRFAGEPPVAQLRSALGQQFPGDVQVQPVTSERNLVIIGTEAKDESVLTATRQRVLEALPRATGAPVSNKLDFNNAGQEALADKLREPLQRAGVALSEQQLQDLARSALNFRNTPPRSGLIQNFDQLSGVQGVPAAAVNVMKQELSLSPYSIQNIEWVGAKVGSDLQRQAIYVVLSALAGMLVYIAFRFEWIYGVAAVIAVFHDTIITIGLFSLFNKEITLTVVAALLTLVGYSMNDTIVVFDRIRENLKSMRRDSLDHVVNASINQTLSRTVLTSGLTLLTALALWLFGGPVLNGFSFALVVGIIVGTYSSIFIASPILIAWQNYIEGRKKAAIPAASREAVRRGPVKSMK